MHIKGGLVYNKHTVELVGFVDIGDINNHLMQVNMSLQGSRASKQALKSLSKTMLVVMIRGLFSSFQFPYAQFACANLTGEQMYNIFWEGVERLERYVDYAFSGISVTTFSIKNVGWTSKYWV